MSSPLLSIIVPVFNVEQYLRKCIDSILAQTFNDFELILIDDGSTDNSGRICDEYSNKDKRIIVIHKENGGLSSARNKGLDICCGSYITFVDSDDYISEDSYKNNISILLKNNDIDILQYPIYLVYDGSEKVCRMNIPLYEEGKILCTKKDIITFYSDAGNGVRGFVWQNIYKSDIFKNLRFKEGIIFEDCYIQSDIIELGDKMYLSGYGKYFYMQRENSILRSKDTLKKCKCDFDATIRYMEKMKKYDVDKSILVKCYCITKNRILDKSYKWNYNNFISFIDRIDQLNVSLKDILISNIDIKKKVKLALCKLIGTVPYLRITTILLHR